MKKLKKLTKNGKELKKDQKGLVGIGTLIIFIAMVIVAAVAAGVLINTSQSLQEQARRTGEETITEVSSGLNILAVKANVDGQEVENLHAIVKPFSGSRGIDLQETVIQYRSSNEMNHLTYDNEEPTAGDSFVVKEIQNNAGEKTDLQDGRDISKIVIEPEEVLTADDEASITTIPPVGFETYYGLVMPSSFEDSWHEL